MGVVRQAARWNSALCQARTLRVVVLLLWMTSTAAGPRVAAGPGDAGPCAVSSQTVTIDGSIETDIYFPADGVCQQGRAAPYPGIVFAHGFGMFGISNGADDNADNGRHLGSWGYVVAIPLLPDGFEERVAVLSQVLSYLESEAGRVGSSLYRKVDTSRIAAVGHSLGGAGALALAARDARIKAVVALDPVYHQSDAGGNEGAEVWDHDTEGPLIAVPACILGAPPSACNAQGDHGDIYPVVGSMHKASYLIVGASHCDYADPGNAFCGLVCGATDAARTVLAQKYMTGWLDYYLYLLWDSYGYLYGAGVAADSGAGLVQWQAQTSPRGLSASGQMDSVLLQWQRYGHGVVQGYQVFRRQPGQDYGSVPHTELGSVGSYTDTGLIGGQVYSYTVRSRDGAGNPHMLSSEVSAAAGSQPPVLLTPSAFLPAIDKP
jgi:predicted dienelactone hydrolase